MDLLEKATDEVMNTTKEESIKPAVLADEDQLLNTELPSEKSNMVLPAKKNLTLPIEYISSIFPRSFDNPWGEWRSFTQKLVPLLKWKLCNAAPRAPRPEEAESNLPVKELEKIKTMLEGPIKTNQVRATWLGHASVLLQFNCANVLCDPVFSDKIGPIKYPGFSYNRYRPPPIANVKDLPPIDAVVISHNHYDHLDLESVQDLHHHFQGKIKWYVPMGLKQWMCDVGISEGNVFELMWWEKEVLTTTSGEDVTLTLTPTQHWCVRTGFDKNQALWGSWAVCTEKVKTWFGGDTGYCPVFKEIGENLGPFHFAAIPIGAFLPRDMMKDQHVDPEESVKIHQDIKCRQSLGIHWGTFTMGAIEEYMEPKQRLREEAEKAGLCPENDFFVLAHGESTVITAEDSIETSHE